MTDNDSGATTLADVGKDQRLQISVEGVTPHEARLGRIYGYVFQAPALYPWRTVERNVTLPLEVMGVPRAERRRRAARYLELVACSLFWWHPVVWWARGRLRRAEEQLVVSREAGHVRVRR